MKILRALLLKDWYLIKKRSLITVLLILFFAVFAGLQGGFLYVSMCTMMMLMLSLTTFAFDQSDGWEAYVSAMPVPRRSMVQSKYLLGFIAIFLSLLLVVLSSLVFRSKDTDKTMLSTVLLQLYLGTLFMSLNYPLIFRFGFEKSRIGYLLITVLIVGVGSALTDIAGQTGWQNTQLISVFAGVVILVLLVGSYQISLRVMKRKEFIEI